MFSLAFTKYNMYYVHRTYYAFILSGVGVNLNDPYENFRKNKGAAFITRMKERALERSS